MIKGYGRTSPDIPQVEPRPTFAPKGVVETQGAKFACLIFEGEPKEPPNFRPRSFFDRFDPWWRWAELPGREEAGQV